jgi:hypothetical protein
VFIGIAVPPLGALLKPYVAEAGFLLLCVSFMRVDGAALRRQKAIVLFWIWSVGVCLHAGRGIPFRILRRIAAARGVEGASFSLGLLDPLCVGVAGRVGVPGT